jgi:CRP/FNR family cyclic AMP-dependent transcriptional regulator
MGASVAQRVDALKRAPIFSGLPDESLERMAELMREFDAPAGQVLIEPRQKGSGMFVIEEGTVEVHARGVAHRHCGPGEIVGELALLTRAGTRTARVRAKTDVRCLSISRADFEQMLEAEPRLAIALLDVVAARLAEIRERA